MTERNARFPSILCVVLAAAACAARVDAPAGDPMPHTPTWPVTDVYHGVAVVDHYRWLEDGADPEVRAWSDAQNARTRAVLDHLPGVDAIRAKLTALLKTESVSYRDLHACGDTLFAMKDQRPKQQPFLVAMDAKSCDPATEHVVLDPNALDAKGTTAIDFYVPSLDGKHVAVSLSERGSESGTVHVYVADREGVELGKPIERVNGGTAGGSVAWNGDGTGFFYTRYPRGTERPPADMDFFQQVWFHKLGTPPEDDRYEVGREFPRIAEIHLETREHQPYVLASVANGDGGEYAHWVRNAAGKWTQVTRFEDGIVRAALGPAFGGDLYLLSRKGSPRGKILKIDDLEKPSLAGATVFVPEGSTTIERFTVSTDIGLCVVDQTGGADAVRIFEPRGGDVARSLDLGGAVSIGELEEVGAGMLIRSQGYATPPRWNYIAGPRGPPVPPPPAEGPDQRAPVWDPQPTRLSDAADIDFSDVESVQEWAKSKDGTKVPFMIVRRKGTALDGNNPTLLSGYGGYGISMAPRYRKQLRVWLDQGGVYAVASTRGGGEFGEDWHKAGNLTKKQNVFDDFAACAERLIELKYTSPARMAFEGGSNGGLLMGAMIVQHPDLCRAVVAHVGIFDMLRVETTPNGTFNVTEFGTVKDEAQFRALYAYSPYHHVVDGAAYPAVLFLTGANDPRVEPYNSRKMTARLQAANASVSGAHPVLLRTSASSGHGMGSSLNERIEQDVDVYAFLFNELGVVFKDR